MNAPEKTNFLSGLVWRLGLTGILGPVALLTGRSGQLLLLFFIVLSHELAHLVAAIGCGYRPRALRFSPGGVLLVLDHDLSGDPFGEAVVAAVGPLHHFLLLGAAVHAPGFKAALGSLWPFFVRTNLSLAFFNLLPVFPLDGGRLLRAWLTRRHGPAAARKIVRQVGWIFSLAFFSFGVTIFFSGRGVWPFLAGIYLLSMVQKGPGQENPLAAHLRHGGRVRAALARGGVLPLRTFAVQAESRVWPSLARVSGRGYIVFWVVDPSGRTLGHLTQEEALAALIEYGLGVRFRVALAGKKEKKGVLPPVSNHPSINGKT